MSTKGETSPFRPSQQSGFNFQKLFDTVFDRIHTLEQSLNAIGYDSKASKKKRKTGQRPR